METTTTTTTQDLRTLVKTKLSALALKKAALAQTVADFKTKLAGLQHAITEVTAPEEAAIEAMEAELKALALEHGPEIFGADRRSLTENGLKLALTETDSVEIDGGEEAACSRIQKQLAALQGDDSDVARLQRLALSACLTVKTTINKRYVQENYDTTPDWFEALGLRVVTDDSASLRAAPKPREKKASLPKPPAPAASTQAAA